MDDDINLMKILKLKTYSMTIRSVIVIREFSDFVELFPIFRLLKNFSVGRECLDTPVIIILLSQILKPFDYIELTLKSSNQEGFQIGIDNESLV